MLESLECIFEIEQENDNLKLFFNNEYLETEFKNILSLNQNNSINKNSLLKKMLIDKFKKITKEKQETIELNLNLENMLLHFSKYKFGFNCNEVKAITSTNGSYFSTH